MPTVHNGIGTWYYGKKNIHRRVGVCEHCQRVGELESYDTTLYFVVLFIPVIPLKNKRVLEQCPVCKRHRLLDSKEWDKARDQAVAEVRAKMEAHPQDAAALQAACAVSMMYQDEVLLDETASHVIDGKITDGPTLAVLADGYGYFSRWQDAENAYHAALEQTEDSALRHKLAVTILKQGRPQEAEPYLRHILDERHSEQAVLINLLVEGYQNVGMHAEALALMERRDRAFPELAATKENQAQRKQSLRHLNTGKPVRSAYLSESGKVGSSEGSWTARLPRIVFPLLAGTALTGYVVTAFWIGGHRLVHVVNGTSQPYTAVINGHEHALKPGEHIALKLAEGDVTVAAKHPLLPAEPIVCHVESPFWSRPLSNRTFVINPDQLALILWEEVEYTGGQGIVHDKIDLNVGKPFYEFGDVDYEFEKFPPQFSVKSGERGQKKRIDLAAGVNNFMRMLQVIAHLSVPEQIAFARREVAFDPSDTLTLRWLLSKLSTDDALALLRPRLADRPVLVNWHYFYVHLMDQKHPETNLVPEYRRLVEETKRAPDAVYLLARLLDGPEPLELMREAAQAQPPSAYAQIYLGNLEVSVGHFDKAVKLLAKASESFGLEAPEHTYYQYALFAARDYDKYLELLRQQEQIPGMRRVAQERRVLVLAAMGDRQAAESALAEAVAQVRGAAALDERASLRSYLCCGLGDVTGYLDATAAMEKTPSFETLFLQGRFADAAAASDQELDLAARTRHYLLYLAASRLKDGKLAQEQWQAILKGWAIGGRNLRHLSAMLNGQTPLDASWLLEAPIDAGEKRVLLLLAAQRFPAHGQEMTALARKLDFQKDSTSMCLKLLQMMNEK
jgi:tetratricopeptide (TPR) repeat protein